MAALAWERGWEPVSVRASVEPAWGLGRRARASEPAQAFRLAWARALAAVLRPVPAAVWAWVRGSGLVWALSLIHIS